MGQPSAPPAAPTTSLSAKNGVAPDTTAPASTTVNIIDRPRSDIVCEWLLLLFVDILASSALLMAVFWCFYYLRFRHPCFIVFSHALMTTAVGAVFLGVFRLASPSGSRTNSPRQFSHLVVSGPAGVMQASSRKLHQITSSVVSGTAGALAGAVVVAASPERRGRRGRGSSGSPRQDRNDRGTSEDEAAQSRNSWFSSTRKAVTAAMESRGSSWGQAFDEEEWGDHDEEGLIREGPRREDREAFDREETVRLARFGASAGRGRAGGRGTFSSRAEGRHEESVRSPPRISSSEGRGFAFQELQISPDNSPCVGPQGLRRRSRDGGGRAVHRQEWMRLHPREQIGGSSSSTNTSLAGGTRTGGGGWLDDDGEDGEAPHNIMIHMMEEGQHRMDDDDDVGRGDDDESSAPLPRMRMGTTPGTESEEGAVVGIRIDSSSEEDDPAKPPRSGGRGSPPAMRDCKEPSTSPRLQDLQFDSHGVILDEDESPQDHERTRVRTPPPPRPPPDKGPNKKPPPSPRLRNDQFCAPSGGPLLGRAPALQESFRPRGVPTVHKQGQKILTKDIWGREYVALLDHEDIFRPTNGASTSDRRGGCGQPGASTTAASRWSIDDAGGPPSGGAGNGSKGSRTEFFRIHSAGDSVSDGGDSAVAGGTTIAQEEFYREEPGCSEGACSGSGEMAPRGSNHGPPSLDDSEEVNIKTRMDNLHLVDQYFDGRARSVGLVATAVGTVFPRGGGARTPGKKRRAAQTVRSLEERDTTADGSGGSSSAEAGDTRRRDQHIGAGIINNELPPPAPSSETSRVYVNAYRRSRPPSMVPRPPLKTTLTHEEKLGLRARLLQLNRSQLENLSFANQLRLYGVSSTLYVASTVCGYTALLSIFPSLLSVVLNTSFCWAVLLATLLERARFNSWALLGALLIFLGAFTCCLQETWILKDSWPLALAVLAAFLRTCRLHWWSRLVRIYCVGLLEGGGGADLHLGFNRVDLSMSGEWFVVFVIMTGYHLESHHDHTAGRVVILIATFWYRKIPDPHE